MTTANMLDPILSSIWVTDMTKRLSYLRLVYSRPDDAPEPDIFNLDGEFNFGSHSSDLDDYRIPLDPEAE